MRKILLVIGLKIVEIVGGAAVLVYIPYLIGSQVQSWPIFSYHTGGLFDTWIDGLMVIVALVAVILVTILTLFKAIPWLIKANMKLADKILGPKDVMCEYCGKPMSSHKALGKYGTMTMCSTVKEEGK